MVTTTAEVLRQHVTCSTTSAEVDTFVHFYIHSLSIIGSEKLACLNCPAVHGKAANDLRQLDYINIAPAELGKQ